MYALHRIDTEDMLDYTSGMNIKFVLLILFLAALIGLWQFSPVTLSITPRDTATTTETLPLDRQTSTTNSGSPVKTAEPAEKPAPAKPSASPTTTTAEDIRFCPKFANGAERGDTDEPQTPEYVHGPVGTLQVFLAKEYGLDSATFVDGIFGVDTENYLKRYQREQSLAQTGVLDSATQERMLSTCIKGLTANGAEYPKQSFTFGVGGVTMSIPVRQALMEAKGSLLQGAFRIELISVTASSARVRVTGRAIDGLTAHTFTLAKGSTKTSQHWPLALALTLNSVTVNSANFTLAQQSTD